MVIIKELLTEFIKLANSLINIFSSSCRKNINKNVIYILEENKAVECINLLKTVRKEENSIVPYDIKKEFTVIKKDLICKSNISGKSLKDNVCNFEFNVVSSNWNKFNEKQYYCYDLNSSNTDVIHPILVSYDGFAKCLRFPLGKAINKNDDVKVQLNYTHKKSMSDKRCGILSDLNYKRINLNNYSVTIRLKNFTTTNIRVYVIDKNKFTYNFLEKIYPVDIGSDYYSNEFITFIHNIDINIIKKYMSIVYFFDK